MDVHSLFRAAPPFLHQWAAPLPQAYEFAWSIQQSPGRLAVVRAIARGHGGEVTLQNRAEGGLRARVTLPLALRAARQTSPASA